MKVDGVAWTSTAVDTRGFPSNDIDAFNEHGDYLNLSWAGTTTMGSHDLSGVTGLTKGGMPGASVLLVAGTVDVTSLTSSHLTATFQMSAKESGATKTIEITEGTIDIQKYQ